MAKDAQSRIAEIMKPFASYEKQSSKDGDAQRKADLLVLISRKEAAKKAVCKAIDEACKEISVEVRAIHRKETRLLQKAGIISVETEEEEGDIEVE